MIERTTKNASIRDLFLVIGAYNRLSDPEKLSLVRIVLHQDSSGESESVCSRLREEFGGFCSELDGYLEDKGE